MDKELFFHTVATESAKAYVSSNAPEYMESGTEGFAKDFSEKYLAAYKVAMSVYEENKASLKKDGLI